MNERLKKEYKRFISSDEYYDTPGDGGCIIARHFYSLALEDILKWAEEQKAMWDDSHSCSNDDYDIGRKDSYTELICKIKDLNKSIKIG